MRLLARSRCTFETLRTHSIVNCIRIRRSNPSPCWRSAGPSLQVAACGMKSSLQIVFISTEVAPWSKVGGLADVLAALPPALAARGHEVLTVAPRYAPYDSVPSTDIRVPLDLPVEEPQPASQGASTGPDAPPAAAEHAEQLGAGAGQASGSSDSELSSSCKLPPLQQPQQPLQGHAELYSCRQAGVERVFVDHPLFLSTDIYGGSTGGSKGVYSEAGEHADLDLRYSILCQAALAAPVLLDAQRRQQQQQQEEQEQQKQQARQQAAQQQAAQGQPAEQRPTVFVANDWPTSLALVRLQYCLRQLQYSATCSSSTCTSSNSGAAGAGDRSSSSQAEKVHSLQALLAQQLAHATSAFCIHNLAYQGLFSVDAFPRLCLPHTALPALCTSSDWAAVLAEHTLAAALQPPASSSLPEALATEEEEAAAAVQQEAAEQDQRRCRWKHKLRHPPIGGDGAAAEAAAEGATLAAAAAAWPADTAADAMLACGSGQINFMRGALLCSDALVTVSPGYAAEVQSASSGMSCGLDSLIAAKGITGIMNGIDTLDWNPATDAHLPPACRYTAASVLQGKARMKARLQERLGLQQSPDAPLVGFVGRLTQQKGVDVLLAAAPILLAGAAPPPPEPRRWQPEDAAAGWGSALVAPADSQPGSSSSGAAPAAVAGGASASEPIERPSSSGGEQQLAWDRGAAGGASGSLPAALGNSASSAAAAAGQVPGSSRGLQLVLLGTGEAWMEAALEGLALSFPGQAAGLPSFSEELAHWMMAACDYVVVPSRFEPCGLVAQCAVRYGAVPVVTAVGGLKDLVTPEVGYCLPAFSLSNNAADQRQNVQTLVTAMQAAAEQYGSPAYVAMQQRGMELDVSWEHPAVEWERLLTSVAARALH